MHRYTTTVGCFLLVLSTHGLVELALGMACGEHAAMSFEVASYEEPQTGTRHPHIIAIKLNKLSFVCLLFAVVTPSQCTPNPCRNGGTCRVDATGEGGFICTCRPGYRGPTCAAGMNSFSHLPRRRALVSRFDRGFLHSFAGCEQFV